MKLDPRERPLCGYKLVYGVAERSPSAQSPEFSQGVVRSILEAARVHAPSSDVQDGLGMQPVAWEEIRCWAEERAGTSFCPRTTLQCHQTRLLSVFIPRIETRLDRRGGGGRREGQIATSTTASTACQSRMETA